MCAVNVQNHVFYQQRIESAPNRHDPLKFVAMFSNFFYIIMVPAEGYNIFHTKVSTLPSAIKNVIVKAIARESVLYLIFYTLKVLHVGCIVRDS